MNTSLDPRVKRLPNTPAAGLYKPPLDQLTTFEVFVEPKEGKPFQHEGAVHAPNLEMAFVLAKEAFTRRFTCSSLFVVDTRDVFVSPMTEGNRNVYDLFDLPSETKASGEPQSFEIFQLMKRGKQHLHAGSLQARSPEEAFNFAAKKIKGSAIVYNLWAVPTSKIRFTAEDEKDLWTTLPEKKFRDAASYKGGDKLKEFLERNNGV